MFVIFFFAPTFFLLGNIPHLLSNGVEANNHQAPQQCIVNNNNRTSSSSNGANNGDLNNSNGNNSILNNKNDFNNVTNKVYHHINGTVNNSNNLNGTLCVNNQNGVSKSVIINIDKNTLDYKNNKNLILNQQQNKVDINGNNTTTNNNNHQNNYHHANHHQIYEKHLNGINQLKKNGLPTKRFIITNGGVENCDNQKNGKFQITKNGNGYDQPDNSFVNGSAKNGFNLNGHSNHKVHTANGHIAKDDSPIVIENIPPNVNIHKVNGHLNGFYSNGHHTRGGSHTVKVTEISSATNGHNNGKNHENGIDTCKTTNGYTKAHEVSHKHHENGTNGARTNGFVRQCSHQSTNGRPNDFSTIKINYVSRHAARGPSNGYVATNATNGTHNGTTIVGNGMHEVSKNAITNIANIPNIVINGNSTELGDKTVNGGDQKEDNQLLGKNVFLCPSFCCCLFS